MLKKLEVYSSIQSVSTLSYTEDGPIEADFVQITNIDGLDPVKANISTVDLGAGDGSAWVGSDVPSRNIVLTLRPNPDWTTWTAETLRQFIYSYFVPKCEVNLIFDSDEVGTVQISGFVESCDANPFTKDPEYIVSIICPDPYFEATEVTTVTGSVISADDFSTGNTLIHLDGNIPIGFKVRILSSASISELFVQIGDPLTSTFHILTEALFSPSIFDMFSDPLDKVVRVVDPDSGTIGDLLGKMQGGSEWPFLQPGDNHFAIMGNITGQDWTLKYFEKYGGI